jgi:hypothetical protein
MSTNKKISQLNEKTTALGADDLIPVVSNGETKAIKASTLEAPLKAYADNAVATKANASDVYTKTEVDDALESKANLSDLSSSPSVSVGDLEIDWQSGEVFYKDVSDNSSFTFSNIVEGKGISVIIRNTSGSIITLSFPSGIFKEASALTIGGGRAAVYSFLCANSVIYMSSITELSAS